MKADVGCGRSSNQEGGAQRSRKPVER